MKLKTVFNWIEGLFAVFGVLASAIVIHKKVMCFHCYGSGKHSDGETKHTSPENRCGMCGGCGFTTEG